MKYQVNGGAALLLALSCYGCSDTRDREGSEAASSFTEESIQIRLDTLRGSEAKRGEINDVDMREIIQEYLGTVMPSKGYEVLESKFSVNPKRRPFEGYVSFKMKWNDTDLAASMFEGARDSLRELADGSDYELHDSTFSYKVSETWDIGTRFVGVDFIKEKRSLQWNPINGMMIIGLSKGDL